MAGFEISIEAVDKASPQLEALSKKVAETAANTTKLGAEGEKAGRSLELGFSKAKGGADSAAQSIGGLKALGGELLSIFAKLATATAIISFFKDSASAAMEEEDALNRVKFAVNGVGDSFESKKGTITAFAEEQQRLTRFSDTDTYNAMSKLVRITGDVSSSMSATRLVFGMAEASGKDYNEVMNMLAPILMGDTSRMRELKKEFGAFTGESKNAQDIVESLSAHFLGGAENVSTYSKQVANFKNVWDDFKETVGGGVLPIMSALIPVAKGVMAAFELIGTSISQSLATAFVGFQALAGMFPKISAMLGISTVSFTEAIGAMNAISDAGEQNITDVVEKYSKKRVDINEKETKIIVKNSNDDVKNHNKNEMDKLKKKQDVQNSIYKLMADKLKAEGKNYDAGMILLNMDCQNTMQYYNDMAQAGILSQRQLSDARDLVTMKAIADAQDLANSTSASYQIMQDTGQAVASNFSTNFANSMTACLLHGKSFAKSWDGIMKSVLDTAVNTFIQIAVKSAVLSAFGMGAGGGGGGGGVVGSVTSMFGLAEGGIVSKPKIAKIAEKEPEAVIPLSRFGEIMAPQAASPSVSVSVSNHVTVGGGMDDAQVADLMTKITEATKRGTVQGLNMSKVLSAQAKKLGNEAI